MAEVIPDFQDFYMDFNRWRELHCPMGPTFMQRYQEGYRHFIDLYYEHEAWDALVDMYGKTVERWPSVELERIVNTLRERRDVRQLKRLFMSLIARRRSSFWEFRSLCIAGYVKESDAATLPRDKQDLLTLLTDARRIMLELGETKYAERLSEDHTSIEQEVRRKPPKPIHRAMDEDCFWELIENAKRGSESTDEQMDHLTTALEAFKAAEIKKFALILEAQMATLAHWDVWALGYVAMDGCSDDAFDYFRQWLILQGRDLVDGVLRDVDNLKPLPSGHLGVEGLLSVPELAHESRSGKTLRLPKRKASKMKGKKWEEEDLPMRYPGLCRRYDYAV
jgi:hypothetical protein